MDGETGIDRRPVQVSIDGAVARLVLNRPEKRNAVNDAMLEGIREFFAAVPEGVRAIVLSGAGGHFSSGLDLSEQVTGQEDGPPGPPQGAEEVADLPCSVRVEPVGRLVQE